jgi:NAD(P)-dependent dehydrogenase (short-subunit alcohol dehydrogenase family)
MSKTIVITGASRGIGFDTALHLCRAGHKVIAVARNANGLEALYNAAAKSGVARDLVVIPADITNGVHIAELITRIDQISGTVDVLINNAGALISKPFTQITAEELRAIYEVNVFAPFQVMQKFVPLLRKSLSAHIVNISSVGGINGSAKFPGLSAYSSSKGALSILSEVLAEEFRNENIRVNCLALGAAQTEMLAQAFPDFKAPLTSLEMGEYVAWFAVNGHKYFNGKILPVAVSTP